MNWDEAFNAWVKRCYACGGGPMKGKVSGWTCVQARRGCLQEPSRREQRSERGAEAKAARELAEDLAVLQEREARGN